MKNIARIGLLGIMLLSPIIAQAVPITITATGKITSSSDDINHFGLGTGSNTILDASITATWSFDTDNWGYVSESPTSAHYQSTTNWVDSTVNIDTSTIDINFSVSDEVTDADTFYDQVFLKDEDGSDPGLDRYFVVDHNSGPNGGVVSYAWIFSYLDNIITSLDVAQTLSWSADDFTTDIGTGHFRFFDSSAYAWGTYRLDTFIITSGSSVPEPSILLLLGLGLAGLGIKRRKSFKV